ncbi:MAG: LapA family protein [Glaciecola sp.]|nr:LapA family protein [Glaciecola sp.]MDG1255574.1 LapA family protein [Glaciecola sp.]MDG1469814.1 LapA family protein [Glaciecola sp.]MDG1923331.1 LapA family protein [Glaciecola sp.]
MKGLFTFLVLIIVLVIAIIIGSRNQELITINYLIAQSELRESTLMAIILSLGVVIGMLTMFGSWLKLSWQVKSLKNQVKRLSKED